MCSEPDVQSAMEHEISDNLLVEKIKAGDMGCFETLVERHKDFAFTIADRILNNREDAEEIAHDAFVKLLTALNQFKNESKFTTWFYRIVMNMAISRTRKKKLPTEVIDDHHEASSTHASFEEFGGLKTEERSYYLNLALSKLKDEARLLLTLFYLKELDMQEIAALTGIDKNNLKVKIFRARKKLAETLRSMLATEVESIF